MFGVVIS